MNTVANVRKKAVGRFFSWENCIFKQKYPDGFECGNDRCLGYHIKNVVLSRSLFDLGWGIAPRFPTWWTREKPHLSLSQKVPRPYETINSVSQVYGILVICFHRKNRQMIPFVQHLPMFLWAGMHASPLRQDRWICETRKNKTIFYVFDIFTPANS